MNLQFAILGILSYFPLNGYDLGKIFDKAISTFWHASLSQIYRELSKLEKNGYVTSSIEEQEDRPDKRIYHITEAGQQAFNDWLEHFPDSLDTPSRDEFVLRIFFGGHLPPEKLKRQFERFLEDRKKFLYTLSENKKNINEILSKLDLPENSKDIGMYFIMRRTLLTNQALIQWAEECIEELERGQPFQAGKNDKIAGISRQEK